MIDFVITWVDGSDPVWRSELEKYNPKVKTEANSPARYRDFKTLKYVLRGIEANAPWVNKVHLVTAGHLPEWLNTSNPKLNILTHADIFLNTSHLPVFNSNAIEMNFIGIRDLSEQFVLFNDDMIILKPVDQEVFFKDGLPSDFLIQNPIKGFLTKLFYPKNIWVKSVGFVLFGVLFVWAAYASSFITKNDFYQTKRYLISTNKELGLIVNFRDDFIKTKRVLNKCS